MAKEDKVISIRLADTFRTGARFFGLDQLNAADHGPFRFTSVGVGFGPVDDPAFIPWGAVSSVDGWEPPIPGDEPKKGK